MSVVIPDELLQGARLTESEIRQELAIALFERQKLTLGQAAELASMRQWEFQQLLSSRRISLHYDAIDFEADIQTLKELGRL